MPVSDQAGGLWFSFEEAQVARAALFLAIYHRDGVASPDPLVHTLTGRSLDELKELMADIDELTDPKAHHLALEEQLELVAELSDDELDRTPSKLAGLLEEARRSDVPVPPALERRLANRPDPLDQSKPENHA